MEKEMKQITKLDRAKVQLVTQHPFFASILLNRPLVEDRTLKTAGVCQRGIIYYNPEWLESRSVDEIVFVLAHEVMHVVGQHALRRGSRQHTRWNYAGDAWINDILKEANVGDQMDGVVDMPGSKDKTTDEIYNSLPEMPDGNGPGGIGDDILDRGGPLSAEEEGELETGIKVQVAQAAQAAKMQGKMSGPLAKIVAEIIDPPTPWYDILERYMTSFVRGDITWNRPNRRFKDVYLPSYGKVAQMGPVVIEIDVSGSISQQELKYYNGHLQRIVEQCNPEVVHVLYTDTRVAKHVEFPRGEDFALEFYSGGGTDMEAGFKFVDTHGIDPEVFVCLTDGYTDFNIANAPSYPVVWCISSDIKAPYGDTIHFTLDQ
jgi:predicted metal-dependent peptidase